MIPENDMEIGQLRLLDVDNKVITPEDTHIRIIAQGADVIHDYAIPSLGLKIDAVPGRLNQGSMLIERLGVFYGQCSEICGVYHGFMPSAVESMSTIDYLGWIDTALFGLFLNKKNKKIKDNNIKNTTFWISHPYLLGNGDIILALIKSFIKPIISFCGNVTRYLRAT
jgi:heme/copper-type cytochrome/quinol oxidase subunit 2